LKERMELAIFTDRCSREMLTTVPKDHMSTAVFHGISIMSSGADHIGVPTYVPEVTHFESAG
jgi:hypothetical protein